MDKFKGPGRSFNPKLKEFILREYNLEDIDMYVLRPTARKYKNHFLHLRDRFLKRENVCANGYSDDVIEEYEEACPNFWQLLHLYGGRTGRTVQSSDNQGSIDSTLALYDDGDDDSVGEDIIYDSENESLQLTSEVETIKVEPDHIIDTKIEKQDAFPAVNQPPQIKQEYSFAYETDSTVSTQETDQKPPFQPQGDLMKLELIHLLIEREIPEDVMNLLMDTCKDCNVKLQTILTSVRSGVSADFLKRMAQFIS